MMKELSNPPKIPAHITHIEFNFHLSLLGHSETFWFWHNNGTTILDKFALYIVIVKHSDCISYMQESLVAYKVYLQPTQRFSNVNTRSETKYIFGPCLTFELCQTGIVTDWATTSQTLRESDLGSDRD